MIYQVGAWGVGVRVEKVGFRLRVRARRTEELQVVCRHSRPLA